MYGPKIAKAAIRKKDKVRGIKPSNNKLYPKTIIIKKVWYWNKHRHVDQWSRVGSPEINPYIRWAINLWQRGQEFTMMNRQSLQWMVSEKLDPYLITDTKINSKWIQIGTLKPRTMKLKIEVKNSLTLVLAMIFWIWHQSQWQQKQK